MSKPETKRARIAILDDFEKVADTVPGFEKLKARADITLLRERLDTSEKRCSNLAAFRHNPADARANLVYRQ